MKTRSLVIGCLVIVLVVGVAVGVGLFFVWNSDTVQGGLDIARGGVDAIANVKKLEEVSELDRQIDSDPDFSPPADDELTAEQVERYVAVMEAVRASTEGRLHSASERYDSLAGPERDASPSQVAESLGELAEIVVEAKRVQVAALEEQGFSREEYSWVKRQIYLALGFGDMSKMDFSDLVEAAREGRVEEMGDLAQGSGERAVPEVNAALVEPHEEELRKWIGYALLGP